MQKNGVVEVRKNNINTFLEEENTVIDEMNGYNHMDAMVFCNLAYLPMGKRDVPYYNGIDTEINFVNRSINEICIEALNKKDLLKDRFNFCEKEEEYNNCIAFLENIMCCKRYKDLKFVFCEIKLISKPDEDITQSATFLIEIKKDEEYVFVSRGTDSTAEGWRENTEMLHKDTNAEKDTCKALTHILGEYPKGKIHLTGHSKGGNNCLYSYLNISKELKNRADLIIFDAPYFRKYFSRNNIEKFLSLENCTIYNIENSVIGELLFGKENIKNTYVKYIKSESENIIREHSIFSFIIKNKNFVFTDQSDISKEIKLNLDNIANNNLEELTIAIDTIFNIIGRDTVNSIFNHNLSKKEKFLILLKGIIHQSDEDLLVMSKIIIMMSPTLDNIFENTDSDSVKGLFRANIYISKDFISDELFKLINTKLANYNKMENGNDARKIKEALKGLIYMAENEKLNITNEFDTSYLLKCLINMFRLC